MNNESITLSLEDSFFLEKGKDATVEDYFKNIDERVNIKIAQGMKQAMHLIIKKLDVLIQNRLSYMVKDEVKLFALDFKCPCSEASTCKAAPSKKSESKAGNSTKKQQVKFSGCTQGIMEQANQSLTNLKNSSLPHSKDHIPICSIISPQSLTEKPQLKTVECSGIASDGGALNPTRNSNLNLSQSQRQGSIETRKSAKSMVSDSELFLTKTPTLGARLRDDEREQYHTQGAINILRVEDANETAASRVSDLDDRRMAVRFVPERAQTPLVSAEMQQAQNEKLSQLIKSPMSSIAENNTEEEIKMEPQHFVETHLQHMTQSSIVDQKSITINRQFDIDQQNMLISDSIIQVEQPNAGNNTNFLDGSMQIDVGAQDTVSNKTHHKRSASTNLVDMQLPQVAMNRSSVEIEKSLNNNDLNLQQHKLTKSPTSTSLSRRSRQSIMDGINSSQKYAKNLSKKYIQKHQEQDTSKLSSGQNNTTQFIFNNNDLSQLSINQSAVKSPSPSRQPPSLIKIKSMLIESQTKSSGTGFQTSRKRNGSRMGIKDIQPSNHKNVNFGNDIQIMNMQESKRHHGVGHPALSKKESDYNKFASDHKVRRPATHRDLTQSKPQRMVATCRKTIFDQPSSNTYGPPPVSKDSQAFNKKLSCLPDLRESQKAVSKTIGAQIARENQIKAKMAAKNSRKAAAITAVVEDTPIGCAMEIKERDQQTRNLKWSHENSKQCSASQDILDEIYLEKDPIGVSLAKRKKGEMPVTTVVRDAGARHQGRFFFYLRLRGPGQPSTVDHNQKERQGHHRPLLSRHNGSSRGQNNTSTMKAMNRDTSIPKINTANPANRIKERQASRNSSQSKIPQIRSSSNLKKVEAIEQQNGNEEQTQSLKDAQMRRKESEYFDQKRPKREAVHMKGDLQQIELEAPPPTEQRGSTVDSMMLACPENSDDMISTQQTSEGLKQSMSNHCDSKTKNIQENSGNLPQKVEIADIDFSMYGNQNKTQEEIEQIVPLIQQSFLSENLDDDGIMVLATLMQLEYFSKDEPIIRYGEPGDKFYILTKGSTAQVVLYEPGTNPMDRRLEEYRIMTKMIGEGQSFGELSILNNEPRSASVIAMNDDCQAYSIDSVTFKSMVSHSSFESSAKLAQQLNKVPMLQIYDKYFKLQLAQEIREVTYKRNDFVIQEGEESSTFYIVLDGEVECLKHYEDGEKQGFIRVRDIKESDHFGELGILSHRPRSMSIRVTTQTCTLAQFSKEAFSRIVFQVDQYLNKDYQQQFDKQLREVVQSKNAVRFPLNQVFSDYNLKYITKKNPQLQDGPSAPNVVGQTVTNSGMMQQKKLQKGGHSKNHSILNVNHNLTSMSGLSGPGSVHNGKIIEKKQAQTNRQSTASVANQSSKNTPEMAKSQISQSIMSSNQAAPPQFIH